MLASYRQSEPSKIEWIGKDYIDEALDKGLFFRTEEHIFHTDNGFSRKIKLMPTDFGRDEIKRVRKFLLFATAMNERVGIMEFFALIRFFEEVSK